MSKQDDIDATKRTLGEHADDFEIVGGGEENGHWTAARPNRQQRRDSLKHDERLVVQTITITFENGQYANLDPNKVMIVDKDTKAQLFDYVIETKEK